MVQRAGRDDELGYFLVPSAQISGDILGVVRQQPVAQRMLWVLAALLWVLPCGFSSMLSVMLQDREATDALWVGGRRQEADLFLTGILYPNVPPL